MRAAVVTFPGSNCDYDCYKALTDVLGAEAWFVWHRDTELGDADAVFLPGGFSYGDYLRAGAIARFSPIMDSVMRAAREGTPVVGICNGFQILCEAGLLPGALVRNDILQFRGQDVRVRVEQTDTIFTDKYRPGQILSLPIAHGEGNFVADDETLDRLDSEGRVVFRYVDHAGEPSPEANPNGSMRNIAGVINEAGNVLGLMPHPERVVETLLGGADGLPLFESLRSHIDGSAGAGAAAAGVAGEVVR